MAEPRFRIIRHPDYTATEAKLWIYKLQERRSFFGIKWWHTLEWHYSRGDLDKKLEQLIHLESNTEVLKIWPFSN